MRAIIVREFGPPDVMKLETVPTPVTGTVAGAGSRPCRRRQSRGNLHPRRRLRAEAESAVRPRLRRRWRGRIGRGRGEGFKHGDRVYIAGDNVTTVAGAGTYAEYALCSEAMLHRLPARVSFGQGAAMGVPYGTAYRALFGRAGAKPAETVFVHGATGGVGIAAVQIARAYGLTVIGSGGTDRGLELVREQGAAVVVNHKEAELSRPGDAARPTDAAST